MISPICDTMLDHWGKAEIHLQRKSMVKPRQGGPLLSPPCGIGTSTYRHIGDWRIGISTEQRVATLKTVRGSNLRYNVKVLGKAENQIQRNFMKKQHWVAPFSLLHVVVRHIDDGQSRNLALSTIGEVTTLNHGKTSILQFNAKLPRRAKIH